MKDHKTKMIGTSCFFFFFGLCQWERKLDLNTKQVSRNRKKRVRIRKLKYGNQVLPMSQTLGNHRKSTRRHATGPHILQATQLWHVYVKLNMRGTPLDYTYFKPHNYDVFVKLSMWGQSSAIAEENQNSCIWTKRRPENVWRFSGQGSLLATHLRTFTY